MPKINKKKIDSIYLKIETDALRLMKTSTDPQHNDEHIRRVTKNAFAIVKYLKKEDKIDNGLLKALCAVHDLTYIKRKPNIFTYFFEGHLGTKTVTEFLEKYHLDKKQTALITDAVYHHTHSFPLRDLNREKNDYIKILQDADTLDFFNRDRVQSFLKKEKGNIKEQLVKIVVKFGKKNLGLFLNYPSLKNLINA